jgi:hypothetical protein
MAEITNEYIFGDDEAPETASVIITGSPSENLATSDDDKSPSSAKTKGCFATENDQLGAAARSRNYSLFQGHLSQVSHSLDHFHAGQCRR